MKKKRKLGRKLLSFLLTLAMVVGLMPGMSLTALAAGEKAYAAYDVTTETNKTKSGNDLTALQVTFKDKKWYIIEDNSLSATSGTVTLLSADTTFGTKIFADNNSNKYSTSQVKTYLDSMTETDGDFADVADAIETVNLTTNKYNSNEEYETVNGVKLYLLSTEEANRLPVNVRKAGFTGDDCGCNEWWLRSPGESDRYAAFVYGDAGNVDDDGVRVKYDYGVRPALKLNLGSVIFSSESKEFTVGSATVDVTGLSLDRTTAQTIDLDGKVSFTATIEPDNATDKKVKWSVGGTNSGAVKLYTDEDCTTEVGADDTDTLTVYAKGISAGSATVTATSNADSGKSASCDVTVNEAAGEKAYAAYDVTTETNKTKSGNDLTALQVTFKDKKWYIIEDNSLSAMSGTVTLLSADTTFGTKIFADNKSNKYSTSQVKAYLDSMTETGNDFADVADAIETVNLTTNKYNSTEEYETVNGVKLYLLSTEEANRLPTNVRKAGFTGDDCGANEWWLRSPGNVGDNAAFVYGDNGDVNGDANDEGYYVWIAFGVRPALKLNLGSVIFSSESKEFTVGSATVDVTGLSLDKTTAQTIDLDGKVSFKAIVEPDNATDKKVKWSVGGTNSGAVKLYTDEDCTTEVGADATDTLTVYAKGISAGSATVTATSNAGSGKSASCDVTVGVPKPEQTITASDVTATYGDTNREVNATVTVPATDGGAISYAVKSGSENYIDVASDGKLTIKAVPTTDKKAYVIVTAAETSDYAQTAKEVTITIAPRITIETRDDGSKVETLEDGFKTVVTEKDSSDQIIKITEIVKDGNKTTATEKDPDGNITKITETLVDGNTTTVTEKDPEDQITKTTETITKEDGSKTETVTEGNKTTVTEKDSGDKVTKTTETVTKEDGSTTETVTEGNKTTVTEKDSENQVTKMTETVTKEDGSKTETVTEGNKTTVTEKDPGDKVTKTTETITKKDGSKTETVTEGNKTTVTEKDPEDQITKTTETVTKEDCQTAHCGRYIPHFDFSAKPSPIVPYRHLPQSLSGMTADCRSLV